MKKRLYWITISLIALMTIFSSDAFAKKGKRKKDAPDVVCINLGEKNPTFDEEAYPDLEFFYVPKIVITNDPDGGWNAEGTPEVLVPWINARTKGKKIGIKKIITAQKVEHSGITNHYGILFDKNDIAAWEGTISDVDVGMADDIEGGIRGSSGSIVGSKKGVILLKSLKTIVKKGKTSKAAKGKTFEPGKKNPVIGIKMPAFDVTNSAGETKSINSIITGNKAPTLVMFFHIPPGFDLNAEEKAAKGDYDPSAKAFFKSMAEASGVSGHAGIFEAIEEQFFGHPQYRIGR